MVFTLVQSIQCVMSCVKRSPVLLKSDVGGIQIIQIKAKEVGNHRP